MAENESEILSRMLDLVALKANGRGSVAWLRDRATD